MKSKTIASKNIDEYIAGFPENVQNILEELRATIHKAVPGAEETISYAIPAFRLKGRMLLYFAGFKNHVGMYPAPRENEEFKKELSGYRGGKGTVQFPLTQPMPLSLITRIVKFKVKENLEKANAKSKEKSNKDAH